MNSLGIYLFIALETLDEVIINLTRYDDRQLMKSDHISKNSHFDCCYDSISQRLEWGHHCLPV